MIQEVKESGHTQKEDKIVVHNRDLLTDLRPQPKAEMAEENFKISPKPIKPSVAALRGMGNDQAPKAVPR